MEPTAKAQQITPLALNNLEDFTEGPKIDVGLPIWVASDFTCEIDLLPVCTVC
jgi:hypothetical protein